MIHTIPLPLLWALPFAGLLLSIATLPLLAPHFWERRFSLVTAGWALAFLVPFGITAGGEALLVDIIDTAAHDYLPFIILLFALFVVAGGIRLVGDLVGTPRTNLAVLALGTLLASVLGTTGASMLLLRPLIAANRERRRNVHVFVFFIFLVGNIGGALTPLGDPPLFLGFLRGVDFTWTIRALAAPMGLSAALLLAVFYSIDRHLWRRDGTDGPASHRPQRLRLEGRHNFAFLAAILGLVLASGIWHPGVEVSLGFGLHMRLENLVRDLGLVAIALASYATTDRRIRIENAFTWVPIREVAVLFAGIFITIVPVLQQLELGAAGAFRPLLALVTRPDGTPIEAAYFWLTGGLSSVLDNAPTYLVFFDLAGGDPQRLMGPLGRTLAAISAGAVFMGANSYLGNAPNFMIKAICQEHGIRMPGFFGYLAWSGAILLPLFGLLTVLFFL